MVQGKVLLKAWVLLWITSLAAAHLHYVRSHFTHLRSEDTARQRTARGREKYDSACWILDGKVHDDKVRGNCTVPVQCPAHVNKREGEKTTVCVLASGSVGVCCASGFNHTAVPRKKSNINNPLARNLVQEVLSRAHQQVEHLFHHQKYLLLQMNAVSHFLDGSTIYGLTPDANLDLRTSTGGRLRVFHDFGRDLLPLTRDKETCITSEQGSACFLAGDSRVDQTVTLVAVHTLFMREHNRLAEELALLNTHWSDETLFEETRAIVIAELQHIFYTEWLPLLIGEHALDDFDLRDSDVRSVYEPTINPSTTNEFSAAAYRYGHSTVEGKLRIRKNRELDEIIKLPDLMFNPSKMRLKDFFDNLLQMMTTQPMQNVDSSFTDALTKFLFRAGNPFGADLVSINIQRGRDHGLRSYNDYRELVGLHRARTFRDFEDIMPPQAISRLEDVYSSPDDVDLYVGGLLEHHSPDAIVGPTFLSIIADQFSRLKRGDRFFYSHKGEPHSFTPEQLHELKKATMGRIICDNSDKIQLKVQSPNAFLMSDQSGNDPLSCNHPSIRRMKLKFWKE